MTHNTLIEVKPIDTKSAHEYAIQANEITGQINKIKIINQQTYEQAADILKNVKAMAKRLEETRKSITSPIDLAKSAVMNLFRAPSDVLVTAEANLKRAMIDYQNEQERIRREQEAKLRREAEEKARKEQERLQARAEKAEANGKAEKAEELREQAEQVQVVAPVLAPTVQKVDGVSVRKNWKARVVDASLVPRQWLVVDEKKLDQIAKATKGSMDIPGVEFFAEDVLASR